MTKSNAENSSGDRYEFLKPVPPEEWKQIQAKCSGIKRLVEKAAHEIEKFPDYQFSTADGRTFGLFLEGERILKLLQNQSILIDWRNEKGTQQIKDIAGLILEIGASDPPFYFKDHADLALAWAELHLVYDVRPTEDEYDALELPDLWPPDEDEEDE